MNRNDKEGMVKFEKSSHQNMKKPLIIIISGPPGSGKTTLAKKISEHFQLPLIVRDEIKESMFDTLGIRDRDWSEKLGMASYDLLYYFSDILLSQKIPFIMESNFKPEFANQKFLEMRKKHEFESFQIHCHAPLEILLERFKKRAASDQRHPGHGDENHHGEFKEKMSKSEHGALSIGGGILELETTEFNVIDVDQVYEAIKAFLEKS